MYRHKQNVGPDNHNYPGVRYLQSWAQLKHPCMWSPKYPIIEATASSFSSPFLQYLRSSSLFLFLLFSLQGEGMDNNTVNFSVILAATEEGVIGHNGGIPWNLKGDKLHFKSVTQNSMVIMGRKTWESIPAKFRPLPNRINVVLSRNPEFNPEGATVVSSLDEALKIPCETQIFVIGGVSLYEEALRSKNCYRLYLTKIWKNFEGDTRVDSSLLPPPGFERFMQNGELNDEEDGVKYSFLEYERIEEQDEIKET